MKLELERDELRKLVARQLQNLFLFDESGEGAALDSGLDDALRRTEFCFAHRDDKYYRRNGEVYFNPFHSGQYSIFLYYLSNSVHRLHPGMFTLADRLYYLNKALNGFDLFYEVQMPAIFHLDHPVGAVLGRAVYGDYFFFSQNCTVGNNRGLYPTIGRNVRMMSGSKILGQCVIGNDVIVAANSYVKDTDVPPCSLVFGASPDLSIVRKDEAYFRGHLTE